MQKKVKSALLILIPSFLMWFLGYGMILLGNKIGYTVEIAGAILSYIFLFRLLRLFKDRNRSVMIILSIALTLYFLVDVLTNAFFLVKFIIK